MDLDLKDVGELGLTHGIFVLILNFDLSIVVELACELKVVVFLDLEIVASSQWMNKSLKAVFVLDYSSARVSK